MPRTQQENARIRDATRARILRHAMALFARNGFAGTSMRTLAARAGISVGLIYRHFPSREAILVALFEESLSQVRATLVHAATGTTPAERVERLLRAAVDAVRGNLDFWRLSYGVRHQPAVMKALGPRLGHWTRDIQSVLAGLLGQSGVPAPDVEAALLFATVDGVCQHLALSPRTYPVDAVVDALVARTRALLEHSHRKDSR